MSEGKRTDEIQGEILHVYDDIEEADNALPTWWLLTFFGAVAFGLVYWFYYHEYGIGKLQPEVYAEQMAAVAAERTIVTDESLEALMGDEAVVEEGVSQVTAYVLTMRNTKLEGGKPVEENAVVWNPDGEVAE